MFGCFCVRRVAKSSALLPSLNRLRVFRGSAFKRSVSPWVKVVRYQAMGSGVMLLKGLL